MAATVETPGDCLQQYHVLSHRASGLEFSYP